ncbi:MAG: ComEC/Rec2 family competence protein [Novosphingobium sp.]|uniref:ComEC/Rec2 family competence protein n=1 Tax=Novosphingobium sp. TaxID=1874826 RepID=UPI0032BA35DF
MSSALVQVAARAEHFLESAGYDRGPWAVIGLAAGIAAWFSGANIWQWLGTIALALGIALVGFGLLRRDGAYTLLRQALMVMGIAVALGCMLVWAKAWMIGARPIARPMVERFDARVLAREDLPAQHKVRLIVAAREPGTGRAIAVRLGLDADHDRPELAEGALLRVRARLVPPAPPMLPGGYDFARSAWFAGLSATGSVLGPIEVLEHGSSDGPIKRVQRRLSQHVRLQLDGSPGALAAAFASGDRGAIAPEDEDAMRDAGLTHLLSISGLHVSAVVAAGYVIALRLLALFPWLALRIRLPVMAAGFGAGAGIGYTLLTGAQVPTIRSCIGAVLVLLALALGREPLSMRLIAVAAAAVLLIWPEALVGPSFQMSFAAVIAIVALHGTDRLRAFFAPREEAIWQRGLRQITGLLLTGVVIELALMPIGLFHFHRAGVYGALANVVAIPLTTLASMPLIALALLFDAVGAGAPFWWLAGKSLELLLALAHWTASMPGAVTMLPAMGHGAFGLFVAGGLWLALWRGRVRLWGFGPAAIGLILLAFIKPPDLLISGDGRHVGITGESRSELLVLRQTRSDYTRDNLLEQAGMDGETRLLDDWPGAQCTQGFCAIRLNRGGRNWQLLLARGTAFAEERALAAACERTDIVVAARYLPRSCKPRWFKADRRMLDQSGGLSIDLSRQSVDSVAQREGEHGWWSPPEPRPWRPRPQATGSEDADAASATIRP